MSHQHRSSSRPIRALRHTQKSSAVITDAGKLQLMLASFGDESFCAHNDSVKVDVAKTIGPKLAGLEQ